jgi:hypothetical protein
MNEHKTLNIDEDAEIDLGKFHDFLVRNPGPDLPGVIGSTADIVNPWGPPTGYWQFCGDIRDRIKGPGHGEPHEMWQQPVLGIIVITAVNVVVDRHPDGQPRPCFHLSVSREGFRVNPEELAIFKREWRVDESFEEDNHIRHGITRHFWRFVAEDLIGLKCLCQNTEPLEMQGDYPVRPADPVKGYKQRL